MSSAPPEIVRFGDAALLISYPEQIQPATNELVHALAERIQQARRQGVPWLAPVPAFASLLVRYEPLRVTAREAEAAIRDLLEDVHATVPATGRESPPLLEIPVRYGGDDGPDLGEVARRTGLSPDQVVQLHSGQAYRAYFLGFAPGFAYLAKVPVALQLPRRTTPRQHVPAGSVAIAGEQTAVYPLATPGGWHLLGRTEQRLWDVRRDPPALIVPGQLVRFVPPHA